MTAFSFRSRLQRKPGTCALPGCRREFERNSPTQKYCPECRKLPKGKLDELRGVKRKTAGRRGRPPKD